MAKPFLIIGNGSSGTSLLRGLMNAHSQIECLFECWGMDGDRTKQFDMAKEQAEYWIEQTEKSKLMWGNKVPIEQFITRGWDALTIAQLIDDFKVIFIIRRFSMYCKDPKHKMELYTQNWNFAQDTYWLMRERAPERVISVSFEDLLLHTTTELFRICEFLGVLFEVEMLKGTMDTGHRTYNQASINVERV